MFAWLWIIITAFSGLLKKPLAETLRGEWLERKLDRERRVKRRTMHLQSIAVANVLGSKILNNTLLLAVAVFGAMYHGGFYTNIEVNPILGYQMILVTVVTLGALAMMFKKEIGIKVGIILAIMYIVSLFIQFMLPQDLTLH